MLVRAGVRISPRGGGHAQGIAWADALPARGRRGAKAQRIPNATGRAASGWVHNIFLVVVDGVVQRLQRIGSTLSINLNDVYWD